ncbi:MAG: GDP-mannose 4,6-dehydratase [Candidatus Omnitrophica bacterium]|nr:GDP-mannose 4,6-dehydratase [Candidatus Omnitrophota bacterium]
MKVLITGGAGFIGSHLAEKLIERGDEVYIIDNLSTGRLENIKHLAKNENFHYTIDSIMNEKAMDNLASKCEHIYHLAAAVGVKLIMDKPIETIETNVRGTEIVLKVANRYKCKVLIASTSEIYGNHVLHSLHEDDNRVMGSVKKRRWAYAASKATDEFLALAYYDEKKLPVVITRFFNTVGPRQTGTYGMVIPNFIQDALLDKPITVYGDGDQSRSFTYVGDVVDAVIKLMSHPDAVGNIFNIGSEEEITINELASKVKEMAASKSAITHIPYEEVYGKGFEDMRKRVPNINRIKELIGYKSTADIDMIIKSVIEYFKS